ncbi:glycerate kinase, partial [Lactiplantibacillus plantarum]
ALGRGAKRILILTGETGVSDGGLGLLQALGVNFYDEEGHLIGRDKNLLATNFKEVRNLESVVQQFNHVEIMIATNTDRPYAGYRGAQRTWGMDKGGTKKQIEVFDKRMDGFFMTVIKELNLDLRDVAG